MITSWRKRFADAIEESYKALEELAEEIGGEFHSFGVIDQMEYRGKIYKLLHTEMLNEVKTLKEDFNELIKSEGTQYETIAKRMVSYQQLRTRLSTYNNLLHTEMEVVDSVLSGLEEDVRDLMVERVE